MRLKIRSHFISFFFFLFLSNCLECECLLFLQWLRWFMLLYRTSNSMKILSLLIFRWTLQHWVRFFGTGTVYWTRCMRLIGFLYGWPYILIPTWLGTWQVSNSVMFRASRMILFLYVLSDLFVWWWSVLGGDRRRVQCWCQLPVRILRLVAHINFRLYELSRFYLWTRLVYSFFHVR